MELISAIFGIVGTLLGTIIGFYLNERSTINREKRTTEQQSKTVRVSIALEIEHNLAILQSYWKQVHGERQTFKHKQDIVSRLLSMPPPSLTQELWRSQLPLVATTFHSAEIEKIYGFYTDLKRIRELYALALPTQQTREQLSANTTMDSPLFSAQIGTTFRYANIAEEIGEAFEKEVLKVLTRGNPIDPKIK